MGKGTKGKSSATSATRKKHAKKAAGPVEDGPPVVKRPKGKKKDKEPRKKVYIPPTKPAPVQPDPLETTGLAHSLPPELLVVLRSFAKKAEVTKLRALEELQAGWVDKAAGDEAIVYVVVEMLPVWLHHVPALFVHPSRRVRSQAAAIHSSLLELGPVRDQFFFFVRESASPTQLERILGTWAIAAHDIDKAVATSALKAWRQSFGPKPTQLALDDALRTALLEFVEQTILDPDGVFLQLHPVQPNLPPPKKGAGRPKEPEQSVRNKSDEAEESDQDKKARLRIGALGALGLLVSTTMPERALTLFSNPAFLTCLYPLSTPPWIEMDAFGHGQPPVRKAAWTLVHILVARQKATIAPCIPALSRAMLRSAWVEPDSSVQSVLWQPLLVFLKDHPSAWEIASAPEKDEDESDDESDDEEAEETPKPEPGSNAAYADFLEFLRQGCRGAAVQNYPVVIIALSTLPSSIIFSSSFTGLSAFFSAFWEGISSRSLASLAPPSSASASPHAAFLSSLLESLAFLVRRLMSPPTPLDAFSFALSPDASEAQASSLIKEQLTKVWEELAESNLRVEETYLAKYFSKCLGYLQRVNPELYESAWSIIRTSTTLTSRSQPKLIANFLKYLSEADEQLLQKESVATVEGRQPDGEQGDEGEVKASLLGQLAGEALAAYETLDLTQDIDEAKTKQLQLLPDLLERFGGDLFNDEGFAKRMDTLLTQHTPTLLSRSPSLLITILASWTDESKTRQIWQLVLHSLAAPPEPSAEPPSVDPPTTKKSKSKSQPPVEAEPQSQQLSTLSLLLSAISQNRLGSHLTPASDVFDGVASDLFARSTEKTEKTTTVLRGVLQYHTYFMSDSGFLSLFSTIITSLNTQLTSLLSGHPPQPSQATQPANTLGIPALLDLAFSTYTSSPSTLSTVPGLSSLMVQIFLYGRLLPLCPPPSALSPELGNAVREATSEDSYQLANDLWFVWYSSSSDESSARTSVLTSIKTTLKSFITTTDNELVTVQAVLSLLTTSTLATEFPDLVQHAGGVLAFLPSPEELEAQLELLSSDAISPTMAVIDPLLSPSSSSSSSSPSSPASSTPSYDTHGFTPYARSTLSLLLLLSSNRSLAKRTLWALHHFLVLSLYIRDFQCVPSAASGSPAFGERALGVRTDRDAQTVSLGDVAYKVEQITTYLVLSGERGWRRGVVKGLSVVKDFKAGNVPTAAAAPVTTTTTTKAEGLADFFVQAVLRSARSESARDTRVLRVLMEHFVDDDEVEEEGDELRIEDVDGLITVARRLEKSAPETSLSILSTLALSPRYSALPKLDRYRNEVAASITGIPATPASTVNTLGLLSLRKLSASAPDPTSDIVFLPQLRAVNVVKTCQKWFLGASKGDDDEDDEDEDEDEVSEEVENAMLSVFVHLAPILQHDIGSHWEFMFDLLESVLGGASVYDDSTVLSLSLALKLVMTIEDLCLTNKALRAAWEPYRTGVLGTVRDLAADRKDNAPISVPRSTCRELLLTIVQRLPASLIDHETLGKMCHLITDPSTDVQKMAYGMLKTAAEKRTEYLVIEVGVGNIGGEASEVPATPTLAGPSTPTSTALKQNEEESQTPEVLSPTPEPKPKTPKTKGRRRHRKPKAPPVKSAKKPGLLPEELVDILAQDVSGVVGVEHEHEHESDDLGMGEQRAFGWMLGWMLVFDLFKNASFKIKSMYIEQLRNDDLVGSRLLPTIVSALRLEGGLSKAFKVALWGVDEFYVEYYEPSTYSLPVLAAHLYFRSLLCVPSLVHTWVLDCKDRQLSNAIVALTSQNFSPLIIQSELAHVKGAAASADGELSGDGMSVKVVSGSLGGGDEVVAAYAVDEHQLEIRLKIPSDWPLHKIEVKDEKRVGVDENRWRAWVLAVQQTIWAHNGRIVDGLSLFKKNVTLHFEGQVECAICYSIISVMDGSLPKKPCKTCKNRFHAGCLYKWFNTSHSSSCPLCRTNII